MNRDTESIQDRMMEIGNLLLRLAERPEALTEMTEAFDAQDPERFRRVADDVLGSFEFPPAKCDPYVRVIVTILKPPKFVRQCEWVYQNLSLSAGGELSTAVVSGADADRMIELLERLGLIKCKWVLEQRTEVLEVDKFVQGICPPGTF